jgi:hypothetical protein
LLSPKKSIPKVNEKAKDDLQILESINNDFKDLIKPGSPGTLLNKKTQRTDHHEDFLNDKNLDRKDLIVQEDVPEAEMYERIRKDHNIGLFVKLLNTHDPKDYWANKVIKSNNLRNYIYQRTPLWNASLSIYLINSSYFTNDIQSPRSNITS